MNDTVLASPKVAAKPLMLKVKEVAANCGVSLKTVYRWITNDGLPIYRLPGTGVRGITLISPVDLEAWLRRHRIDPALFEPQVLKLDGRRFIKSDQAKRA